MNEDGVRLPDWKRLSLFETQLPSSREVIGGLVASVGATLLLPLVVIVTATVVTALRSAAGLDADPPDEPVIEPVEVIEARFVMLGSELDPRQLPDRYLPSLATAPPPSTSPSDALPEPAPPEPPPTEASAIPDVLPAPPTPAERSATAERTPTGSRASPQAQAIAREDALTRIGDRADALSSRSQPRLRAGDPDGIPEGTETRATGDIYLGQLYSFFRRGWQAPTDIPDAELRGLSCVVEVVLTADARVGTWRIQQPSGSDSFDRSVEVRMAQTAGSALPPPPADVAERYLGHSISLRFLGRSGR